MKTYEQIVAPVEYTYLVVDSDYNVEHFPSLIGCIFRTPPTVAAEVLKRKTLAQLMKEGIVREEKGEYIGRADDGIEVSLCDNRLGFLDKYLAEFGPSDW